MTFLKLSGNHLSATLVALVSFTSLSSPVFADPAVNALPTGGQIVSGSGSISQSGNALTVNQNTGSMVANWTSFDIGSQASVNFIQPGSESVALNRVSGGVSEIFGKLTANGQVILINPNGIIFGRGSQVNVGGLVASALDGTDAELLSGNKHLSGTGTGEVTNAGTINVPKGGVVALISPRVTNEGNINASGGSVALAAGSDVTLDFNGDGLVNVAVNKAALDAAAKNKGTIVVDGGVAVMSARSANAIMDSVVNNEGVIQADTLVNKGGRIILDGGDTGSVNVGGTLQANGAASGQKGGNISVTGKQVNVANNAMISASGAAGGGVAHIGGGMHGTDSSIANAKGLSVSKTATINVNATDVGNGGEAVLWSDGITDIGGSIQAKAGANGGNGGFIETSGHILNIEAGLNINIGSAKGNVGTWLLDPIYSSIGSTEASVIVTALLSGNVVNQSSGGTDITADIISSSGNDLSFESTGRITIDAHTISTNGGDIYLGGFTGGNSYATGQSSGQEGITLNGTTLNAGAGDITINGQGYNPPTRTAAGSIGSNENAGIGVKISGSTTLTGANVTVSGSGGDGQDVVTTTGQTSTVNCSNDFTCASEPGSNGVSVSAGDGKYGVYIASSTNLVVNGSATVTINATGGDGGSASFQHPETGGDSAQGGSGDIGYVQDTNGNVTLNSPLATINARSGFSGGGSGSGYWYTQFESEPYDVCDSEGCTTFFHTGNKLFFTDNDGGTGTSDAFYILGNLTNNHGTGSILNINANDEAIQAGGALTASYVLLSGLDGAHPDFVFAQSGNHIDRIAAHNINNLYVDSAQDTHIGTIAGVAGITTDEDAYIRLNSAGATLTQDAGATFSTDQQGEFIADNIVFNNTANSITNSGDTFGIRTYTAGRNIVIGGTDPSPGNDLFIPTASIGVFSSNIGWLDFGSYDYTSGQHTYNNTANISVLANTAFQSNVSLATSTGNITITGNLSVPAGRGLQLLSPGTVNATGKVTAQQLAIGGGGTYLFPNLTNAIGTLASNDTITLLDLHTTGGASNSIFDIGAFSTHYSNGGVAWNTNPGGNYTFYSDDFSESLHASDRIYVNSTGGIQINPGRSVIADGTYRGALNYTTATNMNQQEAAAVVLVAAGDFGGSGATIVTNGPTGSSSDDSRFLVYSSGANHFGDRDISSSFKMYAWDFYNSSHTDNGTSGYDYDSGGFGRSLPAFATGSGFLYAVKPTLTITPLDQSGTYGNSPSLSTVYNTGYTGSGFIDSDTGTNITMTTPVFSTTATSGSAVGDYDISYTSGLVPKYNGVELGYNVVNSTNTGGYTVNQRPITITATSGQNMVYGDSLPTLTYSVTTGSLVNTGTNGALSGNLVTNATSASDIGSAYNITQGTLDNANYDITYVGHTFTVNSRPITITTNAGQSKIIATDDPVFTYSSKYTGNNSKPVLVNGDTFAGALHRDAGEDIGQYDMDIGTLTVLDGNSANNYTITFVPDKFTINPLLNTSTFTSAQNGITGTSVAAALASNTTVQAVGPGNGSSTIADVANAVVVTDATGSPEASAATAAANQQGGMTLSSHDGTDPVSVQRTGDTTTVSFGNEGAGDGGSSADNSPTVETGIPLFVSGSSESDKYNVSEGSSHVSATLAGSYSGDMPKYDSFSNPPVKFTLNKPNGESLEISVGISTTGVLVIQVPEGEIKDIDRQTTLAIALAAAKKNFGASVKGITSAVIVPSK